MYQRYFKQRKFGKVFSFALIVGSGLSHYVKQSIGLVKNAMSLKTLEKYEEYLPRQVEETLQYLNKAVKHPSQALQHNNELTPDTVRSKLWRLSNNLNRGYGLNNEFCDRASKKKIIDEHYKQIYSPFPIEKQEELQFIRYYCSFFK